MSQWVRTNRFGYMTMRLLIGNVHRLGSTSVKETLYNDLAVA